MTLAFLSFALCVVLRAIRSRRVEIENQVPNENFIHVGVLRRAGNFVMQRVVDIGLPQVCAMNLSRSARRRRLHSFSLPEERGTVNLTSVPSAAPRPKRHFFVGTYTPLNSGINSHGIYPLGDRSRCAFQLLSRIFNRKFRCSEMGTNTEMTGAEKHSKSQS